MSINVVYQKGWPGSGVQSGSIIGQEQRFLYPSMPATVLPTPPAPPTSPGYQPKPIAAGQRTGAGRAIYPPRLA